jgi:hypothetical protein
MTGRGDPSEYDLGLIGAIAKSALDQRYAPLTKSSEPIGGLTLSVPDELLVMRREAPGESLYAVPRRGGPFETGRLMVLHLQVGDLSEVASEQTRQEDAAATPAADPRETNQLLLTWLANLYRNQNGRPPSSGELTREKINDTIVHGVMLPGQPNGSMQRTLWAASPDGRHAAIVDVYAENRVARVSHYVAKMVLARLQATESSDAARSDDSAR